MDIWIAAGAWTVGSALASLVSPRLGIVVLIAEMFVGMTRGDVFGQAGVKWLITFASIGLGIYGFLITSKIDAQKIIAKWNARKPMFAGFLGGMAFGFWVSLPLIRRTFGHES